LNFDPGFQRNPFKLIKGGIYKTRYLFFFPVKPDEDRRQPKKSNLKRIQSTKRGIHICLLCSSPSVALAVPRFDS